MPIFISDAMIEWMGFEGGKDNDMTVKRKHFLKTLKRCDPSGNNHQTFSFDELSKYQCDLSPLSTKTPRGPTHSGDKSNSDEHAQLPGPSESDIKSMYPTIEKDRDTSRRKYVMVDTDLFQKILMRLDTSKGDQVRDHFVACKKLLDTYVMYQNVYQELRSQIDSRNMQLKMDKMITLQIETNNQLANTNGKLENAKVERATLTGQLENANGQLENAKVERATLTGQLENANGQLENAKVERANISEQLEEANGKLTNVTEQLEDATDEVGDLSHQVGTLNINVDTLHDRLGAAAPDHVYPPQSPALSYVLMLYGNGEGGYKCIRVQQRNKSARIASASSAGYHNHVLTIPNAQGAINTWRNVRDSFRGAKFVGTTCILAAGVAEADLVAAVSAIDTGRRVI
jgi:predicted  nucleic acid-binding Zn-ribbon protein